MIEYYDGYLHDDAAKYGCELKFSGKEGEPLDTPYNFIFQAALHNLYVWVREGVPAPHAPKIDTVDAKPEDVDYLGQMHGSKMKFENHKDVFGNTTGGIRMAALDYPVGKYVSFSKREDGSADPMFGTVYPFSKEFLKELYGSLDHYRKLVEESAEESIALGFLLREDKEEYVERTVEMAKRRGLE